MMWCESFSLPLSLPRNWSEWYESERNASLETLQSLQFGKSLIALGNVQVYVSEQLWHFVFFEFYLVQSRWGYNKSVKRIDFQCFDSWLLTTYLELPASKHSFPVPGKMYRALGSISFVYGCSSSMFTWTWTAHFLICHRHLNKGIFPLPLCTAQLFV